MLQSRDAACWGLGQISFAEMVLKGHGFSEAEPCHQSRLKIGLQPRRLYCNLERARQRLKAGFQAGFNGTTALR